MDIATPLGLLLGAGLILGAIMFGGGALGGFVDVPSILVVIGGTIAVTFVMFPMSTVFGSIKIAMKTLFVKVNDPSTMINQMVGLAEKARKESIVALEKENVPDPYIKKGILLVADGNEEELVRSVMEIEVALMRQRHIQGQGVFKAMGTMAPAFGMIGTLIGLVKMLQNMSDPAAIGPAMAVALLTTLYGAIMANLVFLPFAKKLEERSAEESLYMDIAAEGVVSILQGVHPTILKDKLQAFLPPNKRSASS